MGYELDNLMKSYGVLTPNMASYAGDAVAPTAPIAPVRPQGGWRGDLAAAVDWLSKNAANYPEGKATEGYAKYKAAQPTFDQLTATYNTNMDAYKPRLAYYNAQQAIAGAPSSRGIYDRYKTEYQNRIANANMYSQPQYVGANPATPLAAAPVYSGGYAAPPAPAAPAFRLGLTPKESLALQEKYAQEGIAYADENTITPGYIPSGNFMLKGFPALANRVGLAKMADGGSVKHLVDKYGLQHYAGEEEQEPFDSTDSSLPANTPATPAVAPAEAPYTMNPQIAEVMQRNRAQQEEYNTMLNQSLNSPEMSKIGDSEKYLRLASAFLSPTKTGAFTENLGLAAGQMSEINKSQREAALSSLKLKLAAQKLRVEAGRDELQALKGAYPAATPGQTMTQTAAANRLSLDEREHQRKIAKDAADEEQRRKDNAWRYSASGELDPKEIRNRDKLYPKATSALKSFNDATDSVIKDIDALVLNTGLYKITGPLKGREKILGVEVPHFDPDATKALSQYKRIIAKGVFQELAKIRATGGTLGSVTTYEEELLKQAAGALDRSQSAEDVSAALTTLKEGLLSAKTNISEEYANTYAYRADKPAPAKAAVAPNAQSLVDYYKSKKKP